CSRDGHALVLGPCQAVVVRKTGGGATLRGERAAGAAGAPGRPRRECQADAEKARALCLFVVGPGEQLGENVSRSIWHRYADSTLPGPVAANAGHTDLRSSAGSPGGASSW